MQYKSQITYHDTYVYYGFEIKLSYGYVLKFIDSQSIFEYKRLPNADFMFMLKS
jgi:hypothetical protein